MKNENGSVTVYFSVVLLLLIALLGSLIEGARVTSMKVRLPQAARAAAESLLSCYERDLFSEYGLLYYRQDSLLLTEAKLYGFFLPEIDINAGKLIGHSQLLRLTKPSILMTEGYFALSGNAASFKKQVLELMKYQEIADLVQAMEDMIAGRENANECLDMVEDDRKSYESTDWQNKADEIEALNQGLDTDDENFVHAGNGQINENVQGDVNGSLIGGMEDFLGQAIVGAILGEKVSSAEANEIFLYEPFLDMEGEEIEMSFADRVLFDEYVMSYFGNLSNPSKTGIAYEQEYILNGFKADSMNLAFTLQNLLAVRGGMNLVSILADKDLRSQADLLSAVLVGWTGIEALVLLVRMMLYASWALGEGVLDVRALAHGGKIPFYKKANNFKSDIYNCLSLVLGGEEASSEYGGINYNMYMRYLLATASDEIYVRTMKMIDINMRIEDKGFSFVKMLYGFKIRADGYIKPIFGGAYRHLAGETDGYYISTEIEKSYN